MATSCKQVFIETTKGLCEPITTSREAKQALREPIIVSIGTNSVSRQRDNVVRETTKVLCEPILTSRKAKQAPREPTIVSKETNSASCQHVNVVREAIKVPCEPKTASSKATWAVKSIISSLDSASCEAKIVSNHKTISVLCRAKPRLSCETKAKAFYANSEAMAASLTSSALLGSAELATCKLKPEHLCVPIALLIQRHSH